ncbi:eukaryotic translation initiation factor 2A [Pycnococcus provasolii]|uniref:Eukaryotic translation initiation factor 2A n=1 Tax=Pycnococcus provasolii TaxID=41880 RepID=A0A830HCU9_9CHLO|nr:eukaryotic translation initiation factor 2A [Pycnococcus provasolii]|eukprot:CAMPEP_0119192034 /NCGR_PEP_ID=MMETSP1316-20130426/2647_1 /TAXON_ID=41880 /ORGANISM="Pycnococcus provasolii, Strain RCC2336" /LENGTH=331 /DNA_ID=CAMNT_0007187153 /DNA_START=65 /DNA_END=1060 /DNA_ORIENTATION=+
MASQCRMYENKFPDIDDVVMIQVKSIAEMGAYVQLLEYNNIEGMILLSELSRRRIRSISKLIKVGRQEPVMVMRVDKEKGYIDLSKRRVSAEDVAKCDDRYNKSKVVHSIMRHVAEKCSLDVETLYESLGWPLYKKYGHAFDAFRIAVTEPDTVLNDFMTAGEDGRPALDPNVREQLMVVIRRRMTPTPIKIRADIEMTCFAFDGVLHIKDAMRAGEATGTEEAPVKCQLVATPLYVLTTQTIEKDVGIKVLTDAIEAVRGKIEPAGGKMNVKEAPRTVSERDERILADKMNAMSRLEDEDESSDEDDDDESMGNIDVDGTSGLSAEKISS